MSKSISVKLTEQELTDAVSALLFSSSVNVVSNTNKEYQTQLFDLAKKLKEYKPNIKLKDVQFLQEDNYEDCMSSDILESFNSNFEQIVKFENE